MIKWTIERDHTQLLLLMTDICELRFEYGEMDKAVFDPNLCQSKWGTMYQDHLQKLEYGE